MCLQVSLLMYATKQPVMLHVLGEFDKLSKLLFIAN